MAVPERAEACPAPGSAGACPRPGPHRSKSSEEPGSGDKRDSCTSTCVCDDPTLLVVVEVVVYSSGLD